MSTIFENLARVRERIAEATERSGRNVSDVKLIAVSKTVDEARVREAIAAGATDLGENYVQEALEKWETIGSSVRWHFIGHLQKNKARQAVRMFTSIQSVDSLELAVEIGKRAESVGTTVEALVEVNISGEASKFGVLPEDALDLAAQIADVPGIEVQGFMGMPPFLEDPEDVRPFFARLKGLWDKLPKEQRRWLSMGMSHDFEAAIEEGSNMVRVGTAIFGARQT